MKETFVCAHCGVEHDIGAAKLRHDGEYICVDCALSYHTRCDYCDKYELDTEIKRAAVGPYDRRRYVCRTCAEHERFEECEDCGHLVDTYCTSFRPADGDREVCPICRYGNYRSCHRCHEVFHIDDLEWDDDEEEYYCEDCWSKRSVIRNYSYKPRAKFKTSTDWFHTDENIKELLMGVENEIDNGDDPYDTAAEICDYAEDIYVKHDGSLGDNGLELVSHPCTLDYHVDKLGWDGICEIARSNEYKSHDARTCGLHIHVGRRQLGENFDERDNVVARIVVLVDRHWDFMKEFSRRTEYQLNEWAERPCLRLAETKRSEEWLVSAALETQRRGRYQAVNLTNDHTIEFRLFNGTLRANTIYASLQMVSNICLYCKEHSMEDVLKSNWQDIVRFKKHKELETYIKERELTHHINPPAYFLSEEAVTEANRELRVGDRVKMVSATAWDAEDCMVGHEGIVRFIVDGKYGVDFGKNILYATHTLGARLPDFTGYWCSKEDLMLVTPEEEMLDF